MRVNSRAWPHRFEEVPWREIATSFDVMAAEHPEFAPLARIVASVLACGGERHLAALTSMHDLVVTARPVPEQPPIPVVVVRSPSSGFVGAGGVFIEHRSVTGHDDGIFRDGAEAVPLFWRFMIEKFGVEPMADLEQRYRAYLTCLNERRFADLSDYAHDPVVHNGRTLTVADFQALLKRDVQEIPDLHYAIETLVVQGDRVGCRIRFDCTPAEDFRGLPTAGRTVSFVEHVFYRYEDGKIAEIQSVVDTDAIRDQLTP